MRKKIRNIIVNNVNYVYWYNLDNQFTKIYLSVLNDKTIKIIVNFRNKSNIDYSDSPFFHRLSNINVIKGSEEFNINILSPKFVSELINYILDKNSNIFYEKNKYTNFDGYLILEDMGYNKINPNWSLFFW